ncbi:tetratricopeptide repeat protein [Nitrosarchaeum koreense]|uniref:TPR repeat-containing protein n=1 Tax=Nitrosarchaeum koreense MY1 TaxID=1001994 RepID=F9CV78_9ARCH|nr:tetratricopeptide repeat protein [Nitrosarchaeum koreense]EGP93193.1 TPR repeat-containing protein [Nitrosarchaeum koreense MY1]
MTGLFSYPKRRLKKLVKDGDYSEALEFGKSLEKKFSNDPDYMFMMGSIYFILEDAKRAIPYFEKASKIEPNDVETLTLKTNVHLALQQKDEAIDCCKRIIKLQPENYEAHGLLEKLESL